MPIKYGRTVILISCAAAIFWPGAFIFGIPGVMRRHRQQTFSVGSTDVGQTIFWVLTGAYWIMPHMEGIWLWASLAAVIGFAFGTLFAVAAPLVGECFGMAHFGAILGLIFTAYGFLSEPLGPWLSGYILDLTRGNYTIVSSYLGIMYLASAAIILLVRLIRK